MEENNIIICSQCYEENIFGAKTCCKCGAKLYYNTKQELEEITEDDLVFFYEENFDTFMKYSNYIVAIDNSKRELVVFYRLKLNKIISFDSIIECRISENSSPLETGGVGRAIVGGLLAGDTGAIVGANTRKTKNMLNNFSVNIVINDINEPIYTMNLVNSAFDINSAFGLANYKNILEFANKVYATIQTILNDNEKSNDTEENKQKSNNGVEQLEQLEKLAELKEKGIITEQEFEETKKKILSKL